MVLGWAEAGGGSGQDCASTSSTAVAAKATKVKNCAIQRVLSENQETVLQKNMAGLVSYRHLGDANEAVKM